MLRRYRDNPMIGNDLYWIAAIKYDGSFAIGPWENT